MNPMVPIRQIESFADLPTSDRKIRRLGVVIIAVIFGLFGTWAAVAPLDGAAYAPGVVTVQAYRKTVQHLEGGIVKGVGQVVPVMPAQPAKP
ncbi:HlyD [Pseudomonas ogarae]|nr:HlyD [Pseudomonas ogarae]